MLKRLLDLAIEAIKASGNILFPELNGAVVAGDEGDFTHPQLRCLAHYLFFFLPFEKALQKNKGSKVPFIGG